jgi:hypothetical protein
LITNSELVFAGTVPYIALLANGHLVMNPTDSLGEAHTTELCCVCFAGAPSSMGSEGDEEAPVFKKMEGEEGEGAEPVTMEEDDSALPPAEDLFSEIHLGQLKRLEKQLESSETEKQKMCASAREVEESLDAALREVRKVIAQPCILKGMFRGKN